MHFHAEHPNPKGASRSHIISGASKLSVDPFACVNTNQLKFLQPADQLCANLGFLGKKQQNFRVHHWRFHGQKNM